MRLARSGCARFSPGAIGGGSRDRPPLLLREVVFRGEAHDLLGVGARLGPPVDRGQDQTVAVIVQEGGREAQTASHVIERVVSHHVKLLKGESSDRGLLVLMLDDGIDALLDRLNAADRASDRSEDVFFARITSQEDILLAQPAQAHRKEKNHKESEHGQRRYGGKGQGQLVEGEVRHGAPSYTRHMRPEELKTLLKGIESGRVTVDDAFRALAMLPVEDIDLARLDIHRELRQGMPEAIYAEGKSAEQVAKIAETLLDRNSGPVLATRVSDEMAQELISRFPECTHHGRARLIVFREQRAAQLGRIAVVCAGTSDLSVAEEAAVVAEAAGAEVDRITDVGVAGLHRLLAVQDRLHDAEAIVVVAGMEGALASLVGGITPAPVIAVPTSVGYGASFEGLAALLAMLNSCAAGVAVMNIDNGFGAAMFAVRTLKGSQR